MPVVAGSRHTNQAPSTGAGIWKCPACGKENTGEMGQGCVICGAGKPGQKAVQPPPSSMESAFFDWLHPLRGRVDQPTEVLLWEAFKAGYEMAGTRPAVVKPEPEVLKGTAESRTIRAALVLFIDQVLQFNPVEVQEGEFLSVEATRRLLEERFHE